MAVSDGLLKLDRESLPVDDDLRALLDRRRAAYRANPDAGSSWADVRRRLLARR